MKVKELQRVLKTYLKPDDEIAVVWFQKSDFEYEEEVTDETWSEAVARFHESSGVDSIDSNMHDLISSFIEEVK
jgi:hypothetical protein